MYDLNDTVVVTGKQFKEWRETGGWTLAAVAVVLRRSFQTIVNAEQQGASPISQPLAHLVTSMTERTATIALACNIEPKEVIRVHS